VSLAGVPETSVPASILVVDDDRRVVELLTIALNAYGFRVLQATDGEEALRVVTRERPDLVVLDVRLPKRSGYEVCEVLRQDPEDPQLPIIMSRRPRRPRRDSRDCRAAPTTTWRSRSHPRS
jgi:DNA-binding response OmpR family regulator